MRGGVWCGAVWWGGVWYGGVGWGEGGEGGGKGHEENQHMRVSAPEWLFLFRGGRRGRVSVSVRR